MTGPSYLDLLERGELARRAHDAPSMLKECRLCPRSCGVDRLSGAKGFCRTLRHARVAGFGPHFGEESPLVGTGGSGTIFISSCNLLCTFCQNCEISHLNEGEEVDAQQFAAMMLDLQSRGCHNINLVTPSHVVPQIIEALCIAAKAGLNIPIVYNSGGYDGIEALRMLEGLIDVYMPDFKFWDEGPASRFCSAPDYAEVARRAILEMHRQVGDLEIGPNGLAGRGLIVRHLVMPGGLAGTARIMDFLAREVSTRTYVNVMDQYRPCFRALDDPSINRRISASEYGEAVHAALKAGVLRLDGRSRIAPQD
jgi:putative pyruvate formate lyase activating enzyme